MTITENSADVRTAAQIKKAEYYQKNKAKCNANSKRWAKENIDKRRAIVLKYDEQHRESNAARGRTWHKNNTERAHLNGARYRMLSKEAVMLKNAKRRAKTGNLEFSITVKDIVIPEHCPIFGTKLEGGTKGYCQNSPSLDRIDSSVGYTPDNIWVISYRANVIKNDGTPEEHELIAKTVRQRVADKCP